MPPKKGKAKKSKKEVPTYFNENEIDIKTLNKTQLRDFYQKLYKSLQQLEFDQQRLVIEENKLLSYWNILVEKYSCSIDEEQALEFKTLQKVIDGHVSMIAARDNLTEKWMRDLTEKLKSILSLASNKCMLRRTVCKVRDELTEKIHEIIKERFGLETTKTENLLEFGSAGVEDYEQLCDRYAEFSFKHEKMYIHESFKNLSANIKTNNTIEDNLIKKRDCFTMKTIEKMKVRRHDMAKEYDKIYNVNARNTALINRELIRIKEHYELLAEHEKNLKNTVDNLQDARISSIDEKNRLLDIIENGESYEKLCNEVKNDYKNTDSLLGQTRNDYVQVANEYKKNQTLSQEKKEYSLNMADKYIVKLMVKKILPKTKTKIKMKRIRLLYYILARLLRKEPDVNKKIKEIVKSGKAIVSVEKGCEYYDDGPSNSSKKGTQKTTAKILQLLTTFSKQVDDDPFCLNVVSEVAIGGTTPHTSLYDSYKSYLIERKSGERNIIDQTQTDDLLKLLRNFTRKHHTIRTGIMNCLKRNQIHIDNFPVRLDKVFSPNVTDHIEDWEEALLLLLVRKFLSIDDEEDEEEEEEDDEDKVTVKEEETEETTEETTTDTSTYGETEKKKSESEIKEIVGEEISDKDDEEVAEEMLKNNLVEIESEEVSEMEEETIHSIISADTETIEANEEASEYSYESTKLDKSVIIDHLETTDVTEDEEEDEG